MRNLSFLFFLFIFATNAAYSQNTINIPGDYATIQEGINAANNGDIVLVADGTYLENINFLGKAITVASYFLVDADTSHITNTIIDGSQPSNPDSGSVVLLISGEDTTSVLCGFTITGGTGILGLPTTRAGGGISVYLSGAKICNNIIEFNSVNNAGNYALGGGIFIGYSSITIIKDNIIRNNSVDGTYPFGGGISLSYSGLTQILSNKIIDNEAIGTNASGGGVDGFYIIDETVISGNYIKGNDAQLNGYGGGGIDLYNWGAPITVSNNLIVDNNARWGGGVLVDYVVEASSKSNTLKEFTEYLEEIPVLINNTIINNFGTVVGGIYGRGSTPDVINNIVWGNTYTSGGQIVGATVTYSDVEGGYTGTGNIDCNPEFLDTTYFLLSTSSCCIDAGNPDPLYNDVEDPNNPGYALYPAMGTLRNDMGTFGGPNSTWSSVLSNTLHVPADYSTIQEAIDAAINGNVVLVADGTYYENISFKGKAITVASHFLVDSDTSHISNTIIDGSQASNPDSGSVVYFISGEDTTSVLCGFTITGGTGTKNWFFYSAPRKLGGGVFVFNSNATIKNNIIKNNTIGPNGDILIEGGGIGAISEGSSNYIIENNVIFNNTINSVSSTYVCQGGGILSISNGDVRIINNKICDNTLTGLYAYGGGIQFGSINPELSDYLIANNLISGNVANGTYEGGSGGIDIYTSSPVLINNLIINNSARKGGAMWIEYGTSEISLKGRSGYISASQVNSSNTQSSRLDVPFFENNTIVNNTATSAGGGIYIVGTAPQLMNFIIWGNTAPNNPQIYGTADVQYSDVEGGYPGEGNIDEIPNFDDSTYFVLNYHSPCIDKGNPDPIYNDVEDPQNPGFALLPARGTVRNDMGHMGGPNSLWALWDPPVSVERNETEIPSEFTLSQNYPNPFNPTTTINYGLKEMSFVELKIYDILGREVTLLRNEEQDAGFYEVNFNASKLASGIYLYQIKAGNFIETKKMALLK